MTTEHTSSKSTRNLGVIIAMMLIAGVTILAVIFSLAISAKWGVKKIADTTTTNNSSQSSVVVIGKQKTLYRFDNTGCAVNIEIHDGEASWYPKGGKVIITPPLPAQPWEDAPGILTKEEGVPHPPGKYGVCKKNSDAWGIEVWN